MIAMRLTMQRPNRQVAGVGLVMAGLLVAIGACTPRVEVTAPDKPITINLNVKIDHEIRVKVDKQLDDVLSDDGGLF
jgi:hypothetical protein